ncbi:MAG TPA: DciA family protein [Rhizomicrobium sp.]|nr:DciA family protein [Rhizomicrobium sp.]
MKDKQPEPPPPRRNRTEPVAREAGSAAASAFARAGFGDPTLVLRWDEIVGPEVARIARPLRLSESASGGVLTLKAEPAASLFLQHETRALCDRINAYLGRPAVSRLRFVQGPLAARDVRAASPAPPAAAAASDPARRFRGTEGLQTALLELARVRKTTSGD